MSERFSAYLDGLADVLRNGDASTRDGRRVPLAAAIADVAASLDQVRAGEGTILFVGNGGSAAIASHMAIDFLRNGGLRAMAFNDGAALTCLGNDFGYEQVFAHQVRVHARQGDLLFAISSSGCSENILRAVMAAIERRSRVVTMSGFASDNPLRALGDVNFYLPSDQYGFVEIGHQTLIHAILDLARGWGSGASTTVSADEAMEKVTK